MVIYLIVAAVSAIVTCQKRQSGRFSMHKQGSDVEGPMKEGAEHDEGGGGERTCESFM
jgi:hypothetical protein